MRPFGPDSELSHWWESYRSVRALGAMGFGRTILYFVVTVANVLSEIAGLAMVYPLLAYVERRSDVAALSAESKFWARLVAIFDTVNLPINYLTLAVGVILMITLRQVFAVISMYMSSQIKEDFTAHMRERLFSALIGGRATYLNGLGSGAVTSWFGLMTQQASMTVNNLLTGLSLAVGMLFYFCGMMYMSPMISGLLLAVTFVGMMLFGRTMNEAKLASRMVAKTNEEYSNKAAERLRAWRLIKLTGSQNREAAYLGSLTSRIRSLYNKHVREVGRIQILVMPAVITILLVAIYVADSIFHISLSILIVFAAAVVRLAPLVEASARLRQNFSIARASLERLLAVLAEADSMQESDTGTREFSTPREAITFRKLSYRYNENGSPALADIDLQIPANCLTAIIGPSGAGKSTLIDLLPRLLVPESGVIEIDGVPLAEFRLESLRRGIAFVSQQTLLLDDSIRNNLIYANTKADEAAISEACRLAHVQEFVAGLPQGLETRVGEGGALLSGGQRQRLMLARAFLSGAGILILDEPTSALDWESENMIRQSLRDIRAGGKTTIIVIAHRPSTIADADMVVVLQGGRISEVGRPADMVARESYLNQMITAGGSAAAAQR